MILFWSCVSFEPPTYGKVQYPDWGVALGWCISAFVIIWIPVVAVYKLLRAEGSPWKVCMTLNYCMIQGALKAGCINSVNFWQ